jgi:hypothetical protein
LLDALRTHRVYVPSTLTFPQLDISATSERLRLVERGEENGRDNRPASDASQPDRVESEIDERIQVEYAHAADIYRKGLENYDRRIYGTSLETLGVEIHGAAQDAVAEYTRVALQAQDEISLDRKDLDDVGQEFENFKVLKQAYKRIPDSGRPRNSYRHSAFGSPIGYGGKWIPFKQPR